MQNEKQNKEMEASSRPISPNFTLNPKYIFLSFFFVSKIISKIKDLQPKTLKKIKIINFYFKTITKPTNRTCKRSKRSEIGPYSRESVAGVWDQHASFTNGSISHCNALYKPRRAHFRRRSKTPPFPLLLLLQLYICPRKKTPIFHKTKETPTFQILSKHWRRTTMICRDDKTLNLASVRERERNMSFGKSELQMTWLFCRDYW